MAMLSELIASQMQQSMPTSAYFGEVIYQAGAVLGPRVQADVQFVVVHAGEARITVDGHRHDLPADHVCCLLPGHTELFEFSRTSRTHHSWLALHFEPLSMELRDRLSGLIFAHALTRRMSELMELGLSVMRRRSAGDGPILLHLGGAFFHAFAAAHEAQDLDRPVPQPVARARRYIESHHAQPVELHDVAKAAGVTENHIVRLFSKHVGHTPMRYLWRVRVQHGADLLRDTGLSIGEIAYRVGFSTPYHFSRLVKQQLGLSPKQVRASHWNAAE